MKRPTNALVSEARRPALKRIALIRATETRHVGWDAYVNVRGNRYSVPSAYCGQMVTVRISLDDELVVYAGERCIAQHRLVAPEAGWQTVADHHLRLWAAVRVRCTPTRRWPMPALDSLFEALTRPPGGAV